MNGGSIREVKRYKCGTVISIPRNGTSIMYRLVSGFWYFLSLGFLCAWRNLALGIFEELWLSVYMLYFLDQYSCIIYVESILKSFVVNVDHQTTKHLK